MNLSRPISDVIPSSDGPVLRVLAAAESGLSARAIAEMTDGAVGRVQAGTILKRLTTAGIVIRESRPPAHIYRLSRDHVAARPIIELASLRETLISRMRGRVESLDPAPYAVWLFGSFARGDGRQSSDIDVLVLRSDEVPDDEAWMAGLAGFGDDVQRWSGNVCTVVDYSISEFERLIDSRERLPVDIARDGIRLAGVDIPRVEILRANR